MLIEVLIVSVVITVNIWFLVYLIKLEKEGCKCSLDWRRYYIIAYIFVLIGWNVFNLVYPLQSNLIFSIVMVCAAITFIVFTFQYLNLLKSRKCNCSEDIAKRVLNIYTWVLVGFFVIICLQLIVVLLLTSKRYTSISNGSI